MNNIEEIIRQDVKNLITATKQEYKKKENDTTIADVFESFPATSLNFYIQELKSKYPEILKYQSLFDDIRYIEEFDPVIQRLYKNLEIELHNKILPFLESTSDRFVELNNSYYVINDLEVDIIELFLKLIEEHISSSENMNLDYLNEIGDIRNNIEFKYTSSIYPVGVSLGMNPKDISIEQQEYLENLTIRTILEIAKYTNEELLDDKTYAKVAALSLYLQSLLSFEKNIQRKSVYESIIQKTKMDSTAAGIIKSSFIQEHSKSKKLKKEDKHE